MRKMFLAVVFAALPLFAQTPPCDAHSITVSGTGTATVVPDRVSFIVGVSTNAPTVDEAYKTNSEKTRKVIAALKALGVKATEIQTSNFSIQTEYQVDQHRKERGFIVTNSVTVTREDPKAASDLLDAAVEAGANEAGALSFFASDPRVARDRAIERAMANAKAQAEKLAATAGATLGRVTSITTVNEGGSGYSKNSVAESITVTSAIVESGVETISYSVTVTYELK